MSSNRLGKKFVGPLTEFAPGFAHHLAQQGYASGSIWHQLRLLRLLSQWLLEQGLDVEKLHTSVVERFMTGRRTAGHKRFHSVKAMRPALDYLRHLSVAPPPSTNVAVGPVNLLLDRYRRYLLVERSLAHSSIHLYAEGVRPFLDSRCSADGQALDLASLTTADVISYVVQFCSSRGNRSAKHIVKVLRSLLRFLHVEGIIEGALSAAVTIEVARLRLDDIDWRGGEIVVHGKGNRIDRLPLPSDVGAALVAYIENGRPVNVLSRSLFIYAIAPYHSLNAGGVASLVRDAARRAGIGQISAHRLRHTAATEMLRAGASLPEIGQVLRHSSAMTTAIYAKVDLAALRTIARIWPGAVA